DGRRGPGRRGRSPAGERRLRRALLRAQGPARGPGAVLLRQGRRMDGRRDPLGVRPPVLRQSGHARAGDPSVRGAAGGGAHGGMKKDDYKRFRIRTVAGADDFASMAEELTRRFAKALEQGSVLPDLVLIDGGRGQLNAALKVLQDLGLDYIPAVGLAKQAEEV